MLRSRSILVLAASLTMAGMGSAALAGEPAYTSEVGYEQNALGVSAMLNGQYDRAITQMNQEHGVAADDSARLINLGLAYAKTGQRQQAIAALQAAYRAPDGAILLSDGSEVSSRALAARLLNTMDSKFAAR